MQFRFPVVRAVTYTMFKYEPCHLTRFLIVIAFVVIIHFGIQNVSASAKRSAEQDKSGETNIETSQNLRIKIDKFYKAFRKRLDLENGITRWWSWLRKIGLYRPKKTMFMIDIQRSNILGDSLKKITKATRDQLLVDFFCLGFEKEQTYGDGITVEWLFLLSEQIFNPASRYFKYTDEFNHVYTLQIRPVQEVNPEDEQFFYFVGRIMGIAIHRKVRIQAYLSKIIYSKVLGKQIELADLEDVDLAAYNSYTKVIEEDPTGWGLDFTIEERDEHGNTFAHNLKPNEENKELDESNKEEYVRLAIEWKFAPKEQMEALLKGLGDIIPLDLLREYFDEKELELLLCGVHKIDVEQWKSNTIIEVEKKNPDSNSDRKGMKKKVQEKIDFEFEQTITSLEVKDDQEIDSRTTRVFTRWFWEIIEKFDDEERIKFLEYVTGSPSLPVSGFEALDPKFKLLLLRTAYFENVVVPPTAQICRNKISIPIYKNKETLERELKQLIKEAKTFNMF